MNETLVPGDLTTIMLSKSVM